MKKILSISMVLLFTSIFGASVSFSEEEEKSTEEVKTEEVKTVTLANIIKQLEDKPFYDEDGKIPYDYQDTESQLPHEALRRKAKNIAARNKYLLESEKYPRALTPSEKDQREIAKRQDALTEAIAEANSKAKDAKDALDNGKDAREALVKSQAALEERTNALREKKLKMLAESEAQIEKIKKGEDLDEKDNPEAFNEAMKAHTNLRALAGEIKKVNGEVAAAKEEAATQKKQHDDQIAIVKKSEEDIKTADGEFQKLIESATNEKKERAGEEAKALEAGKTNAALEFAAGTIEHLEDNKLFADFAMRDLDSLSKDLSLDEFEAKSMAAAVENQIDKSLLGAYIKKQDAKSKEAIEKAVEKSLAEAAVKAKQEIEKAITDSRDAAIKEACAQAISCTEAPSESLKVVDDLRKDVKKVTKPYSEHGPFITDGMGATH